LKKKIIITGGLGFIGTKLINKIQNDYEIIIIDNGSIKNFKNKIKKVKCDLTNYEKLKKIKVKDVDIIVHLAGQSSGPRSYSIPEKDLKLNLNSTINVIKFAKKNNVKKIIFASTFTVYGENKKEKLSESENCNPQSFYSISKYASERYLIKLCEKYKIKWNVLRFFNVYGPGQDLSRTDQGIVSIFLDLIRNKNKILVNGSLKRFRDLVFIDDVIQSLNLIIKDKNNYNQIYNVGTGKKTTIKQLIILISKLYRKENKIKISVSNPTPGDILGCYADLKKIRKDLKYNPKFTLLRGLKLFISWAEKNYYYK